MSLPKRVAIAKISAEHACHRRNVFVMDLDQGVACFRGSVWPCEIFRLNVSKAKLPVRIALQDLRLTKLERSIWAIEP